ncbi:MAG: hypothetical protein AVDCRST_MAG72-1260, partial [uncultured Nocardioidaceae bacterium]
DVPGRIACLHPAAGGGSDDGRVSAPAAQPPGLTAPGLRDGAPAGAARPGPHLGGVLVAGGRPGRRLGSRRGGSRGVLGHHQPPGLARLRVGAARAGHPALRARPVRAQRGRGGAVRRVGGAGLRRGVPRHGTGRAAAQPV